LSTPSPVGGETKPQTQPHEKRSPRKRSAKSATDHAAQSAPPKHADAPPVGGGDLHLQPGDVLLLEEIKNTDGGSPDPTHRHFVTLTEVTQRHDPLFDKSVVEVAWAVEDALPFSLCLSGASDKPDGQLSVARGNIVLADHSRWTAQGARIVNEQLPLPVTGRKFRPTLKAGPLTFRQPAERPVAAAAQLRTDPRTAVPQLVLASIPMIDGVTPLFSFADLQDPAPLAARLAAAQDIASRVLQDRLPNSPPASNDTKGKGVWSAEGLKEQLPSLLRTWTPQRDLLSSNADDLHFVVEMDDRGFAHLRFGDGQNGQAPETGEQFSATYRVGIGTGGNVGAETITQVVTSQQDLTLMPRNPLAAVGGTDPEPIAKVKLLAPKAYQGEIVRAISADDYARLAERNPRVQRAACELRWTGTRYEAHVAIDPLGTDVVDSTLLRQIRADLYRYRRIGHDVVVVPPTYVPLDVAITVQVLAGYARGHIETVLRNIFSDHGLPDGQLGFFHPDRLSFGDSIYVSKLVAAAQNVDGVESVVVTRLQRRFEMPNHELDKGVLPIGSLEVARLGSNRASLENGRFALTVRGGQ
jgi:Baseplate J-like protein